MQQSTLVVFALLAATAAASGVSSESRAQAWLQSHSGTPTDDQLGELKNANPDAYAMVKALLTKHSMGLIKLKPEEKGPDVFRKMMHPGAATPDVPYADAEAHPAIANQYAYNPSAAANKDETMVNSLLDAVAGMSGKSKQLSLLRKRHHIEKVESDPFADDADMLGLDEKPTTPPEQVAEALMQQQDEPAQPQKVAAKPKKENSYLAGLDLSGDMPLSLSAQRAQKDQKLVEDSDNSPDPFASLSFGSVAQEAAEELVRPKPKVAPKPKKKKENSFFGWLGKSSKAPEDAAPATAQKAANPYITDFLA